MEWPLAFISEDNFVKHVGATIGKYGEKLESYDLQRFNKNIIDPIKLIFDKTVYRTSWEEMVGNEIFRQRNKSNKRTERFISHMIRLRIEKYCGYGGKRNGKYGNGDCSIYVGI